LNYFVLVSISAFDSKAGWKNYVPNFISSWIKVGMRILHAKVNISITLTQQRIHFPFIK